MKFEIFALVACCALFKAVSGISLCGLEYLEKCNPYNKTCIMMNMEPGIKKWFGEGRPDYFQDPIEPYFTQDMIVPVDRAYYSLQNVTISGLSDAHLTDWEFTHKGSMGTMGYTYNLNVIVRADNLVKFNGHMKRSLGPIVIRLNDIRTVTRMPLHFITRCSGEEFMSMTGESVYMEKTPQHRVTIELGSPEPWDQAQFLNSVSDTATCIGTRVVTQGFRTFCTQISVNDYFDLKHHFFDVPQTRKWY